MKTYTVTVEMHDGKKQLVIDGLILSKELDDIKRKLGDIEKLPVDKKIKVRV